MSKHRTESQLTAIFKALSNPHRLAVFQRLCDCCAPGSICSVEEATACLTVGELGAGLDIAASTLSHHLKTLAQAGLVQTRREGKQVLCSVDPAVLRDLSDFFSAPLTSNGSDCRPATQDA